MQRTLKDRIMSHADGTKTAKEIADLEGCHATDVRRLLSVKKGQIKASDYRPQKSPQSPKQRAPNYSSVWNEQTEKRLRELWNMGLSCSQIANRLGLGLSRNAVIGKVHRMGLQPRDFRRSDGRLIEKKKKKRKPSLAPVRFGYPKSPHPLPPQKVVMGPEPVVPEHERRGVADVLDKQCRWPIGDPTKKDFHFCSYDKIAGQSYCLHHLLRSVQEPHRLKLMQKYGPVGATAEPQADEEVIA